MSGAGPERLSPGPRPGRAQLPAAPTMAAAALGQVGSRPRTGETGEGVGRRGRPTSGWTTSSRPRPASRPRRSGSAAERRE